MTPCQSTRRAGPRRCVVKAERTPPPSPRLVPDAGWALNRTGRFRSASVAGLR
ncbi:hypothetical protein LX36DRAFT_279256 [Colletotrichum falcatum]|nr:hypothetical protein LX36DRAFT_279256 [Colletotrichum falcatum]